MRITIIYGSPRKGCTYTAAQIFKDEMKSHGDIEFTEFFMPRDLPEFCLGCMACFTYGQEKCPHSAYTIPIIDSMLQSDALIFTSPVYVLQASGGMKNFLDHFGHMFMVHRPKEEMFRMKAFILSTTAGAGTKAAIKTIAASLKSWGVNRVYSKGFTLYATDWQGIKEEKRLAFERTIKRSANKFYHDVASEKKHIPHLYSRIMFRISRMLMKRYSSDGQSSLDLAYWQEKGWLKGSTPF